MNKFGLSLRYSFNRACLLAIWVIVVCGFAATYYYAPKWLELQSITITPERNQSVILGRSTLASAAAANEHLEVWRTPDKQWHIRNLTQHNKVLIRHQNEKKFQRVRHIPLSIQQPLQLGKQQLQFSQVDDILRWQDEQQQQWHYDGQRLWRNNQALPLCRDHIIQTLRLHLRQYRPLLLGGHVDCGNRYHINGLNPDSLRFLKTTSGYVMVNGRTDTTVLQTLHQQNAQLQTGDTLIVGYSHYRVELLGRQLRLQLEQRGQRWLKTPPNPPHTIQLDWQPVNWFQYNQPIDWYQWLLVCFPLLLLPWVFWPQPYQQSNKLQRLFIVMLLSASLLAANLYRLPDYPPSWSIILMLFVLLCWVLHACRTLLATLLLSTLILLSNFGIIAQLQLGTGATDTGWMQYSQRSAALLAAYMAALLAVDILLQCYPQWLNKQKLGYWLALLALFALAALGLQIVTGNEAGVQGFQPVELAKLTLVLSTAYALALRTEWLGWESDLSRWRLWANHLAPILLGFTLIALALMFLHDFSPLVLIFCWLIGIAWSYFRIHPQSAWRLGVQSFILLGIVCTIMFLYVLHQHPDIATNWPQSDRLMVWAHPEQHPHSGYQVNMAQQYINQGQWLIALDSMNNGTVMNIPAIQDDFAPTFWIYRYGGIATIILLMLQSVWILCLILIAESSRRRYLAIGDYQLTPIAWFAYFSLMGGSLLIAAHYLISWGTNLAFLPVMGQPMPFLSAGGSHLIMLLLPLFSIAWFFSESGFTKE